MSSQGGGGELEELTAVILEFAAHFAGDVGMNYLGQNETATTNIIGFAALAWNASHHPEERRQAGLEKYLGTFPSGVRHDFRLLFRRMIEHKLGHYGADPRSIREIHVAFEGGLPVVRLVEGGRAKLPEAAEE